MMNFEKIRWEQEGRIVTLKIANGKANTLSRQVTEELHRALDEAERREDVKEVVITGDGDRFFAAGADINEIAEFVLAGEGGRKEMSNEEKMQAAYEFSKRGQNLVLRLRNFPKPVTALINGMCFGGGFELALGCHRRVATQNAVMGLPEVTLGIIPGWGGTRLLGHWMNRVPAPWEGLGMAANFIQQGIILSGDVAREWGIVDEVIAGEIKEVSLPSRKHPAPEVSARVFQFVLAQYMRKNDEEAFASEAGLFAFVCMAKEAQEGIRAFLEKRAPDFTKS